MHYQHPSAACSRLALGHRRGRCAAKFSGPPAPARQLAGSLRTIRNRGSALSRFVRSHEIVRMVTKPPSPIKVVYEGDICCESQKEGRCTTRKWICIHHPFPPTAFQWRLAMTSTRPVPPGGRAAWQPRSLATVQRKATGIMTGPPQKTLLILALEVLPLEHPQLVLFLCAQLVLFLHFALLACLSQHVFADLAVFLHAAFQLLS